MKRIFAVLLALSLLLLAACSKGVSPTEPSATEPATQAPTEPATEAPTEPSQTEPATEPSQPEEKGPFTVTYAHAQADTHGSGEVWVQLLAEVTNTGSEPLTLGAADWTVCTPDGTELAVRKGVSAYPQTIEPGEKGWYYDEFTVDTAQTGELAVQYDGDALAASIRAAEQSGVRYAVSDVNLKDSVYGGVELTGRAARRVGKAARRGLRRAGQPARGRRGDDVRHEQRDAPAGGQICGHRTGRDVRLSACGVSI